MKLNSKQKRFLRAQAHKLKPIVIVGNVGLTPTVLEEIDNSIEHHELIKIRINASDRINRQQMIEKISQHTYSQLVMSIGHIAAFYRTSQQATIQLP
ncbi:MAG: ribosome assembly RNA-binding protein YhbY [Gammaproteobacteria bacterium]|nr:ribosome assembly RNA-binding protein YhbY [Gammaproteobacteria bacterium]